jgi:clan AA aspartic protease (TIGR02281 family)
MKAFSWITIFIALVALTNKGVSQTTIKLEKEGALYTLPCSVNGLSMKFIFDTGASDVSISLTEVMFMLKHGYLAEEDIGGEQYFKDAKGEISVGTKIKIRTIEFSGVKLKDIEASVVHELGAPLLLGQSAISKLGKYQFDPQTSILTLLDSKPVAENLAPNRTEVSSLEDPVIKKETSSPEVAVNAAVVPETIIEKQKIEWLSWEQAVAKMEKEPRKIMVDVYTDWCGWCKRMDATTMEDPKIVKLIGEKYYAVKMDGEGKKDIVFRGRTYKWVAQGRNGYHELPAEMLSGKMSYPTLVFLDEEYGIIQPLPGYQDVPTLEPILAYFGGGHYKNTPWETFQASFKTGATN